jgi:hypothetical protein
MKKRLLVAAILLVIFLFTVLVLHGTNELKQEDLVGSPIWKSMKQ